MFFRRKETPWEVVDNRSVQPVRMYYEEEEDLDIASVKETNVRRTYLLDVKSDSPKNTLNNELLKAVVFAREQLLSEVVQNGYNVLLSESWQVTLLRKAKRHRVEVEYSGRPALALNKFPQRQAPFTAILQAA